MLAVGIARPMKDAVVAVARADGVDVSELLRSLIVGELGRCGALPDLNCSTAGEGGDHVE